MKMIRKISAVVLSFVMITGAVYLPSNAKSAPSLNKSSAELKVGKTLTLKVKNASGKKATWSSSNKKVATVTKKGNLSATVKAKKAGNATITAKVAKKSLKCKVKVVADPQETVVLEGIESPKWVTELPAAAETDTLVVIMAEEIETRGAYFSFHEKKSDGKWYMTISTPCFIGKNGLGKTKEGDAKTPTGTFHFTSAFGNADDPGCKMKYIKATEYTYWSGDPDCMYNQMIEDCREYPDLDLSKCDEHIVDYPVHYQYCLNISYNEEGTPGLGSGIFLHCFGPAKPWTGGCIAIPFNRMKYIMTAVDENTQIVIDTKDNLGGDYVGNAYD